MSSEQDAFLWRHVVHKNMSHRWRMIKNIIQRWYVTVISLC
ncbi:hypothetical protein DF182_17760 [Chitinophaga flava]|uniref:Uncharacterized protein n=1 Tax=Chitinophaga flava TaxID=2259036 RepID=A0A365XXB7_9BACT|nr:hypothetical protein DF182_17760 [Chitinophaga flava]